MMGAKEKETPDVREATNAILHERGPHRDDEDMHPARLDPAEADLEDALDASARQKRNARREARDA